MAPVSQPSELYWSRREATEVQRLRDAGRIAGTTTTVEHAWAAVTNARALGGIRTEELPGRSGRCARTTRPTAAHTSRRSRHGSTTPATPERLPWRAGHVHPNTLRYRMTRLSEVAELYLHDPETRLALRLQLRALGQ